MYTTYKNFRIEYGKNCAVISSDSTLTLKNADDDNDRTRTCPKYFDVVIGKCLEEKRLKPLHIYTLAISNYNIVTDHKGIWKLAGCGTTGFYESHYDIASGRVYFGIASQELEVGTHVLLDCVSLYAPVDGICKPESILDLFSQYGYSINTDKDKRCLLLNNLRNSIAESVIVYKSIDDATLYVFADDVTDIIAESSLPKKEIVE